MLVSPGVASADNLAGTLLQIAVVKAALCFAGAAGLRHLNMSSNLFSGTVPASWANFSRLKTVNMNHNALSGTVPAYLLAMPALTLLSMVNNTLRGTLPPSSGALPACQAHLL